MGLPTKESAFSDREAHKEAPPSSDSGPGSSPSLPPPPYPLGVISEHTQHPTSVSLRIRQLKSSILGGDFVVKETLTGQRIFDVRGKVSFSRKRTLYDHAGKPLLEFHRSGIPILRSYIGHEPDNQHKQLFFVERKGLIRRKLVITFPNLVGNGEREKWTLKGEWFSGRCRLTTEAGVVVAVTTRDYANPGQLLLGRQTYEVTTAPGVDLALVTAICVCLEEAYTDTRPLPRPGLR